MPTESMCQVVDLYSRGDWSELSSFLLADIMMHTEKGAEVEWARSFSYFGIVQLYLADQEHLATLYKQIRDEYDRGPSDVRVSASFARFLALYQVFLGEVEEASRYYEASFRYYAVSDWHLDEALMILEALHFLYGFKEQDLFLYQALERMKQLNDKLQGLLEDELFFFLKRSTFRTQGTDRSFSTVKLHMKPFRTLHTVQRQMDILFSFLQGQTIKWEPIPVNVPPSRWADPLDGMMWDLAELGRLAQEQQWKKMRERMESCTAKAELLGYPWLRTGMHAIAAQLYEKLDSPFSKIHQNKIDIRFNLFAGQNVRIKPSAPTVRLAFTLFQEFSISYGKKSISGDRLGTRQGQELLIYLLLHPKWQVPKEVLLDELFPGGDLKKLSNRLYVAIHRINRALQEVFGLDKEALLIFLQKGNVCLNVDLLEEVDVYDCRKMLSVANQLWLDDPEAAMELVKKTRNRVLADIVPHMLYIDWLDRYREEWNQLHFKNLRKLAEYYREQGWEAAYEELCIELMAVNPLHEEVYRHFIEFLLSKNRTSEALQWYQKMEKELDQEFGIAPSWSLSLTK